MAPQGWPPPANDDDDEPGPDSGAPDADEADEFWDSITMVRGLGAVAQLARLLPKMDWFGQAGRLPSPALRVQAEDYAAALGFYHLEISCPENWDEAADLILADEFDPTFWQAEAQAGQALMELALTHLPEHDLQVALSHVAFSAAQLARRRAERLLSPYGREDEAVLVAAGQAAASAAAQTGLLLALQSAGLLAPEPHLFEQKFRLFEQGRWPLGLIGGSLHLF